MNYSPHYKMNYCAIRKYKIAKLFSITEESEGISDPKTNDPRVETDLKTLSSPGFLAVNGHFSAVARLPYESSLLFFCYSFLLSIHIWPSFSNSLLAKGQQTKWWYENLCFMRLEQNM